MDHLGGGHFGCACGASFVPDPAKLARIDDRLVRLSRIHNGLWLRVVAACTTADRMRPDDDPALFPERDQIISDLGLPPSITPRDILAWHAWREDVSDALAVA